MPCSRYGKCCAIIGRNLCDSGRGGPSCSCEGYPVLMNDPTRIVLLKTTLKTGLVFVGLVLCAVMATVGPVVSCV